MKFFIRCWGDETQLMRFLSYSSYLLSISGPASHMYASESSQYCPRDPCNLFCLDDSTASSIYRQTSSVPATSIRSYLEAVSHCMCHLGLCLIACIVFVSTYLWWRNRQVRVSKLYCAVTVLLQCTGDASVIL